MARREKVRSSAWKVAYADFITAMMALFLVLWITAQDEKIKEAVERAFRNPFSSLTKDSVGIIPQQGMQALTSRSGNFDSASAIELAMLRRLNEDLLKSLKREEHDQEENPVKLELTPDGLNISIFDRSRKPIFEPDTAQFTPYGSWVLSTLAWEISRYPSFAVELAGHTENGFKGPRPDYGSWEISADRATAARRKLIQHGVSDAQIQKVAGLAHTSPLPDAPAEDEKNRRVTILLKIRSARS